MLEHLAVPLQACDQESRWVSPYPNCLPKSCCCHVLALGLLFTLPSPIAIAAVVAVCRSFLPHSPPAPARPLTVRRPAFQSALRHPAELLGKPYDLLSQRCVILIVVLLQLQRHGESPPLSYSCFESRACISTWCFCGAIFLPYQPRHVPSSDSGSALSFLVCVTTHQNSARHRLSSCN